MAGQLTEAQSDGPVRIALGGTAVSAAAALLMLAAANAAAPVALACPAIAGQTLVYIDIFDGPPEKQADLVPDQYSSPDSKTAWNTWQLEAGPDGLFVTCGYGKKLEGPYSRMETIRLPDTTKSCRADFKTGPRQGDLTLVRFSCQ